MATALTTRPPRARGLLALVALATLLAVAACGTISAFVDLQSALDEAGYSKIKVNIDTNAGPNTVLIAADGPPGLSTSEAQAKAAEIAWKQFPRRFESVRVTIDGSSTTFSRSQLQERYGNRPLGFDDQALGDDVNRIGVGVLISLIVGGLLCVGLVVLIVVITGRSRRRRNAEMAARQAWNAAQYGQGPFGPPGTGGYGQPGPYGPTGQPGEPGPPPQPGSWPPPPPPPANDGRPGPGQLPPGWG